MENSAETELFLDTVSLDIKILDFFSATKQVSATDCIKYENYEMYYYVTAFPNDDDDGEGDWLSARVRVRFSSPSRELEDFGFKWALSLIDIEGRPSYTKYFENPPSPFGNDAGSKVMSIPEFVNMFFNLTILLKSKYLEKSLILKKADEFVSDGSLLLRCDIFCDFEKIKPLLYSHEGMIGRVQFLKIKIVPQTVFLRSGYSPKIFTVFDFTWRILTLPQFDKTRKRFGVYGKPPARRPDNVLYKEITENILKDIWMFDTDTDRFLLSLYPMKWNLGRRLVNASPVIKRCVETSMKEQREKRVVFPDVFGETFLIVLYFLKSGEIVNDSFDVLVDVYKFSHMYQMRNLQQKITQCMTRHHETETNLKEIEEMAELYSDEYLLGMVQSRMKDTFQFSDVFSKDAKPNFDCFI